MKCSTLAWDFGKSGPLFWSSSRRVFFVEYGHELRGMEFIVMEYVEGAMLSFFLIRVVEPREILSNAPSLLSHLKA
jgi:hypothetical protein